MNELSRKLIGFVRIFESLLKLMGWGVREEFKRARGGAGRSRREKMVSNMDEPLNCLIRYLLNSLKHFGMSFWDSLEEKESVFEFESFQDCLGSLEMPRLWSLWFLM